MAMLVPIETGSGVIADLLLHGIVRRIDGRDDDICHNVDKNHDCHHLETKRNVRLCSFIMRFFETRLKIPHGTQRATDVTRGTDFPSGTAIYALQMAATPHYGPIKLL